MLRSLMSINDYIIRATDGDIGHVYEFLVEDDSWEIKYLVVDTGMWIFGRKVLISPAAIDHTDWSTQAVVVKLSREQVKNSPDIDTDEPVSRQQLGLLHAYYSWPVYLAGTGVVYEPLILPSTLLEEEKQEIDGAVQNSDPHLRSTRAVKGYAIETADGEIGHIDDFIVEDECWKISYLVVDTRKFFPGKKVLISSHWVNNISWGGRKVRVNVSTEQVKNSPEFDPTAPVNKEYEVRLYDYYGRPFTG